MKIINDNYIYHYIYIYPSIVPPLSPFCVQLLNTVQHCEVRADADGTHAPHVPRGRPQGSFPPGVKSYFGSPQGASPFVQVYLPTGFLHLGKKSKCLSFADPQSKDGNKRPTLRSREAALLGVQAFAWDWYSSLTEIQKSSIAEANAAVQEHPLKRARL